MRALDTTVVVDYLRGAPAAVVLLEQLADRGELLIASEVVRFELLAGVRDPGRPALESFCTSVSWVPVDESIAREGGELARRYRPSYAGIDDLDYLIAATALTLDAELLTTNVKHFPMFSGLQPAY